MSNYQRVISYIYAYEGGVKGKNIGFAKLETRGTQCRISVSLKRIYVGGNPIGVYLLSGEEEIRIGILFARNSAGEFRTAVNVRNVEGSGRSLEECYGLTVHDTESAWRCYTTIWEDAVAHAAEVDLADVTAAQIREKEEKKAAQIKKQSQKMEAVEAEREVSLPELSESGEERGEEEQAGLETKEAGQEVNLPEPSESGEVRKKEEQVKLETEEAKREAGLSELSESGEVCGKEEQAELETEEAKQEASQPEPSESGEVREKEEQTETGKAERESRRSESGMLEKDRMSVNEANALEAAEVKRKAGLPELSESGEVCRNEENVLKAGEAAPASAQETEGQEKVLSESAWETQQQKKDWQEREDQGREEAEVVLGEMPVPELAEPELSKIREPEEKSEEELWSLLRSRYPKILAFDYEGGCEILTIKPQDIGLLPRENWIFGSNSFLLHGYYYYRYLILARLKQKNGESRYLLGVPGNYVSNEKYMAAMFGFSEFVLSKKQPPKTSRFGYWYRDIKIR